MWLVPKLNKRFNVLCDTKVLRFKTKLLNSQPLCLKFLPSSWQQHYLSEFAAKSKASGLDSRLSKPAIRMQTVSREGSERTAGKSKRETIGLKVAVSTYFIWRRRTESFRASTKLKDGTCFSIFFLYARSLLFAVRWI